MNEGLRLGMFWGGLIMASVPVSFGIGVAIYVLRRHLRERGSTADAAVGSTVDATHTGGQVERGATAHTLGGGSHE